MPIKQENIALFVDVQNIYYTTKQAFQRHFDYNAFWAKYCRQTQPIAAFAYAIDRKDEKQRQFQNILKAIGFTIKLKPYITRGDGSSKGDWDVGITIDILEYAPQVDTIVLASGDGDFDLLVNKVIQAYNCKVEVVSVESLTANSLIKAASQFCPIQTDLLMGKS